MVSLSDFRKAWVKATTFGFFSLLLMIPMSFIAVKIFQPAQFDGLTIPEIFELTRDKPPLEFGRKFLVISQLGHFILYFIVGALLAHFQYTVLKQYIANKLMWTLITILGLELILLTDLIVVGLATGGVAGPFEPLLIALGGGGMVAVFQFLYLRSVGIKDGRWVGWWILGIAIGIIVSIPIILGYETLLSQSFKSSLSPMTFLVVDWLFFILPYFVLIGFFAGRLSANPLYRSIQMSAQMRT